MSRSRRLEIDDTAIRRDYLRHPAAAGIVAEETVKQNSGLTLSQQKQTNKMENNAGQNTGTRKIHPYAEPKYRAAFILLDATD